MTYAGLRSMIYAGLTADDPRVKAARTSSASTTASTKIPASASTGSITTTRRSPRQCHCSINRPLSTARARNTTGGPTSSRPSPSVRIRKGAGSTATPDSWKGMQTSSPPTACWPWPKPPRTARHYEHGSRRSIRADSYGAMQTSEGAWHDTVCDEYGTAMALLVLQMPNNYLPIFQR